MLSHGGYKEGRVLHQGFIPWAVEQSPTAYSMVTKLECLVSKNDVIPT